VFEPEGTELPGSVESTHTDIPKKGKLGGARTKAHPKLCRHL